VEIPVASLALLIASWLISTQLVWISSLVVFLKMFFQPLAQHFTMVTSRQGLKSFSFSKVMHDFLRVAADAALLPHQAGLALDAVVRVYYRRLVSRRGLLEWSSAQASAVKSPAWQLLFRASLGLVTLFSLIVGSVVLHWKPSQFVLAAPWIIMWFFSPFIGWFLIYRPPGKQKRKQLAMKDKYFLRKIARRTWRYFADFVNEESSWLPPDNYQVSHQDQLAMRTSPTNIALWLLSVQAAHDFGYLTVDQVVEKLGHSMHTIGKLELFEGHLLNWYDIKTLTPLEPRYISAVDSGNLLGALWTLEQGLAELARQPVIDAGIFAGLRDTAVEIMELVVGQESAVGFDAQSLGELISAFDSQPTRIADTLRLLRKTAGDVKFLTNKACSAKAVPVEIAYWVGQLEKQHTACLEIAHRYLSWIEVLAEKNREELAELVPGAEVAIGKSLSQAPSIVDLASGQVQCILILRSIRETAPSSATSLREWLNRIITSFEKAKWLAGEMLGSATRLGHQVRDLSEEINMRFLYDRQRRLFSIGYNVSEGRLDNSYYDLLGKLCCRGPGRCAA
jgi:cyclic beta-1,2-glucan synthetase